MQNFLKTPTGTKFVKQLRDVNDQICFSALQAEQFSACLKEIQLENHDEQYLPQIFTDNPYSDRINISTNDLPEFSAMCSQLGFQMGIIAGMEYTIAYLQDMLQFCEKFGASLCIRKKGTPEEEYALNNLLSWSKEPIDERYFHTLGYFRYYRNHLGHIHDRSSNAFSRFVRLHGTNLNRFWDNGVTSTFEFNFKSSEIELSSPETSFAIMNFLRISIGEIDKYFARTLPGESVMINAIGCVLSSKKHLKNQPDRLTNKASGAILRDFGIKPDQKKLSQLVQKYLTKA